MFNFNITSSATISQHFLDRKIYNFVEACSYIKHLPFKRNSNKNDLTTVFTDQYGTCGTKHAILRQLAIENGAHQVRLILGIFKMTNSLVHETLKKHYLEYMPEAHNYLKVNGKIVDCTKPNFEFEVNDFTDEQEIEPHQITDYKVNYHKSVLQKWLNENPQINIPLNELWIIREQCIKDLSR